MVGGEFDLEINFIIHDEQCILYMLDVMEICSVQCQAEIWSTFKGICRKSYRNLQACVEVGLLQKLLYVLHDANEVISELLVDMLCLLASYNISVKELKKLLSLLRAEGDKWPVHAVKLLGVLQATTERHGPDCFFSFPGRHNAAIALPPLKAWPYSNGFTFTTWFRMDPLNSLRLDVDKPYLYCFRNSKGLGYSGHFVGNCFIVTVLKSRGKGFQHCLKFEFKPRKWYMVTVVHIYNRWRSSEIKCYANGQLVSHSEMNWSIGGSDQYDKCFLGSAETGDDARVFCGQIAATYVFNEALSPSQAYALYQLGPSYKNQFKFSTESDHLLANHHRKVLYEDSKLSDSLVLAYNPKSTDGQLCLECSPKSNRDNSSEAQRWFVHNPHALMLPGVKAVVTHSIHSALHSVGGAEVLFPLFSQLNYKQKDGSQVYLSKIRLSGSVKTQQQVLHGKGFLVIGTLLERAHKDHITMGVLDTIMAMAKFLDQLSTGSALMRQFCDYILFNPALWIHTTPEVQIALYTFLATEFVSSPTIQTNLRRVSTVLLLIHALKHYYWVENPQPRSGVLPKGLDGPRPAKDEILSIRAFILLFLKQLVTRTGGILEDELQSILGYLLTMARVDENILDVLQLLVAMVSEHGGTVAPVFDQRNGVVAIFKLLGSRSESVRVHALKLLAYFLKNLNTKRKTELLETQSLFMLVGERLLLYSDEFSLTTYNAMYEVLVEEPSTQLLQKCHSEPSATTLISNPVMLKVIGTILRQCSSPHTMELKLTYLNDLLLLFQMSRDNRRILLQQSVWQDWMLELGYLKPCSVQERDCQELIYSIFKVLLYHAIKLEWGGWRVWVDTLAIVHSKVSFHAHKEYMERMYEEYKSSEMMSQDQGGISAITGIEIVVEEPTGITTEQAVEDEDQRSEDVLQDVGGRKEDGNDRKEEDQNEDDQVPEAKDADVQSDPDDAEEVDQDPTQQAQSEKEGFSQTENGTDDQDQKNDEVTKQSETEEEQPSDGEDESTSQPESSTEDQDDAEDETEEKTSTKEEEINDQVQEDPEEEEISAPEQNNETEDKNEVSTSDSNEVDGQGGKNDESVIKEDDLSQGQIETLEAKTPMEETDEKDEELSPPVEAGDAVGDKSTEEQSPVENNQILRSEKLIKHTKSDGLVNPPFHQASITSPQQQFSPGPRTVVFRVPEFNWSEVHLRLLDDLFSCLEVDIENWKSTNKMVELVNHSDNLILVHNTIHLVSQMIDNVILACGGILPILSSATSPNYELDSVESGHGLSMESAWSILNRLAAFTDVLAFATNINFSEIENEKNMSNGGILRQCLRTACLCAVRNCLELRYLRTSASVPSTPSTSNDASRSDKQDDTKQSQFLALAVVYFVSVLMVSKYRDILDPESHEKLRQATVANRNSPKKKKLDSGASMPSASKVSSAEVEAEEEDIPMDTVVLSNGHRSPENERNEEKEDPENKDGNLEIPRLLVLLNNFIIIFTETSTGPVESPPGELEVTSTNVQVKLCTNKSINFKKETKTLFKPKLQLVIQRARSKTKQKLAQMMNKVVTSIQSSYQSFDRSVVVQSKADDKQGILLPHKNIYFPVGRKTKKLDAETPSTSNMADKTTISTTVATDISMTNGDAVDHTDLPQIDATTMNVQQDEAGDVSSRLERSMDQLAPLLRDIFIDFSSYLSKILTGSHGQELLVEGMVCMKSYTSVVELVMLLCSQEWQNSIQKNAGLAFIELINEGRLLCHAMKDHVVRVANEADFILSKQRAEDVKRHAQFESSSALFLAQQREEERQCDSLITAAKHRDHAQAHALKNRITNILTNKLGAWGSAFNSRASEFWKLDSWEDDTRRRRRFVRNPYGSSHPKATLITHGAEQLAANEDDVIAADDVDQEELQGGNIMKNTLKLYNVGKMTILLYTNGTGPVSFSTEADLIAPGVCLHGTFSITPDEFYFEVLEHHESFAKADPKV
uniref:BEACH-type PH domain-containing protein n=1 Tax=Ciona savignyi TaxID=51511 RepID=H2YT42_CIOSA